MTSALFSREDAQQHREPIRSDIATLVEIASKPSTAANFCRTWHAPNFGFPSLIIYDRTIDTCIGS